MRTIIGFIALILTIMATSCNSGNSEQKIQTQDAIENIMSRKSVRKYLPKPVEKPEWLLPAARMCVPGNLWL